MQGLCYPSLQSATDTNNSLATCGLPLGKVGNSKTRFEVLYGGCVVVIEAQNVSTTHSTKYAPQTIQQKTPESIGGHPMPPKLRNNNCINYWGKIANVWREKVE